MNKEIIIFFFLLIISIGGCDNSVEPITPKTSGETTINSTIQNLKTTGFSFSQGANITYPNSGNIIPDIIALVQLAENGNILGVFFDSGVSLKPSFYLMSQSNYADSALIYFNNVNEVPDSNYVELAIPVKANQIWAIKTVDDKFGKILILETKAYADSSNPSSPKYYAEARFKWVYQPDGSTKF
jgi:hypothetical protein